MPLTVRIGPSRDPRTLRTCKINKDICPVAVSSEHFEGLVTVRVKDHQPTSPENGETSCDYFEQRTRVFSLQWQGQFKATNPSRQDKIWTGDDILFVAEAESKVKVPAGTSVVTRFVRMIDPGFVTDAIFNSHRPWVGSPLVSAMNVLRVWTSGNEENERTTLGSKSVTTHSVKEEWIFHGKNRLEEHDVDLLFNRSAKSGNEDVPVQDQPATALAHSTRSWWWKQRGHGPNESQAVNDERKKDLTVAGMTSYQRRRFFTKTEHREAVLFHPRLIVAGDFFNNFTDFEHAQARMVITVRFDRVLQGQALRFVCKSRAKEEHGKGARTVSHEAIALGDSDSKSIGKSQTVSEEDTTVFFVVELAWT